MSNIIQESRLEKNTKGVSTGTCNITPKQQWRSFWSGSKITAAACVWGRLHLLSHSSEFLPCWWVKSCCSQHGKPYYNHALCNSTSLPNHSHAGTGTCTEKGAKRILQLKHCILSLLGNHTQSQEHFLQLICAGPGYVRFTIEQHIRHRNLALQSYAVRESRMTKDTSEAVSKSWPKVLRKCVPFALVWAASVFFFGRLMYKVNKLCRLQKKMKCCVHICLLSPLRHQS